jgi:hypothetical protein
MTNQPPSTSAWPFAEFLRAWWYMPLTVWRETFASFYHPQLFLGCNIQDANDEYHVLNEVGSYGKQISKIQKVLDVYVAHPPHDLSAAETDALAEYRTYAARVSAALAESRGPGAHELSTGYVKRLETALNTLRQTDPEGFNRVWAELTRLLTSAGAAEAR